MRANVTFSFNKPMEFMYSLFAIGTHNSFYEMISSYNLQPNEKIKNYIDKNKKNLSLYIQTELNYFFELSGLGYILYKIILGNEAISEITELIALVASMPSNDFALLMVRSFLKKNLSPEELVSLSMEETKKSEIYAAIEKASFQHKDRKKKILEAIENPEEIKQRFVLLLKQYYEKSFSFIENELEDELNIAKTNYEVLYAKNHENFISNYLNISNIIEYSKLYIHISFFKYVGVQHYSLEETNSADWFILGVYTYLLFDSRKNNEILANFFKALSDVNRIEIVKLLNERPWFGQELAEKLNLTPATISYHMGFLQNSGLITYKKIEKRSYFSLKKERLSMPLKAFLEQLAK